MTNLVQDYIDELNIIKIPNNEEAILGFLRSLNSDNQKKYLNFILSQSHMLDYMYEILDIYTNNEFYSKAGYSQKSVVPKVNREGIVYYEEMTSSEEELKISKKILNSLQIGDGIEWQKFVEFINSIYESDKIEVVAYFNLNEEILLSFLQISSEILRNDKLKSEIEHITNNDSAMMETGFISRIQNFFKRISLNSKKKRIESRIQDDDIFYQKAISLINKYKGNSDVPIIAKRYIELAEKLIVAGVSKDELLKIIRGLSRTIESACFGNHRIFDMKKDLLANAIIAKDLYSPDIIYADSFQNMTFNIRRLLASQSLPKESKISIEYRDHALGNGLTSFVNLSKLNNAEDIENRMQLLDVEFQNSLSENDPEEYIKKCVELTMKFITIHPFADGNGRTSRMLLQVMLARRGILFPSIIDNYLDRQSDSPYSKMEKDCLITGDYTQMQEYVLKRAYNFNNGQLELIDEPLKLPEKSEREKSKDQEFYL